MPKITEALLLAMDTETTGISTEEDAIVEIGAAYLEGGEKKGPPLRQRVNPGRYIPADATNVHGVRNEDVENEPDWAGVAPKLVKHFRDSGALLVGYNILRFDLPLIHAENARHGVEWRLPYPLDPFIFAYWYHRGDPGRSLMAMCETYEVGLPENRAHRSDADALATGMLAVNMARKGTIPDDVDAALKMQRELDEKLKAEWARFGRFLYEDRETGVIKIGRGKHMGTPFEEADEEFLRWLQGRPGLPDEARLMVKRKLGVAEQISLF